MPSDCSKFYRCANGILYPMSCAPGTLFDSVNRICNHANLVICQSIPNTINTNAPPNVILPITNSNIIPSSINNFI